MNNTQQHNLAFIDGQNLYTGITQIENPWKINLKKFRLFLKERYKIEIAYYFIGFFYDENISLYKEIEDAGFMLIFKDHNLSMVGKKKGNIDSDLVFFIMKKLYKKEIPNKIILVSGDGDYKPLVDFLIEENKLKLVIFPNRKFASSLYSNIGARFFEFLDDESIKRNVELIEDKKD